MSVHYLNISPPATLKSYVRFFWVLESSKQSYMHQSIADVSPELIFHYRGKFNELMNSGAHQPSFLSGIHAQTSMVRRFYIEESFGIFGVYLFPYALPLLFGIPSCEITDQQADLNGLLGKEGSILEEKMMLAGSNDQRVHIMISYLENKLKKARPSTVLSSAVDYILQTKGLVKVKEVAERFNLSERQFERKFKEVSGFAPKLFSRIVRFNSAFKEYNTTSPKTLTEIAHECGYYNQSHFVHDFKRFSGMNPKVFFAGKAEGFDWLAAP